MTQIGRRRSRLRHPLTVVGMPRERFDLVIVGMGSAGMTAAEFAATLPIKVCGVERDRVGGDCLWTGCVPSKALLAAAHHAQAMRDEVAKLAPADVAGYERFLAASEAIYQVGFEQLGHVSFERWTDMVRVLPALLKLEGAQLQGPLTRTGVA